MKKFLIHSILSITLFSLFSSAIVEDIIIPEGAAKFIGQREKVCGQVVSSYYASRSRMKLFSFPADSHFLR